MGMDYSLKPVAFNLRALLHINGVDRGPGASKTGPDELADGIENSCHESGTYSSSRGRMEELAIRLKLEQKLP